MRFNASGNLEFNLSLGGTENDGGYAVGVDNTLDTVYVTGYVDSSVTDRKFFLLVID